MRSTLSRSLALILLIVCLPCIRCGRDNPVNSNGEVRNTDFVASESFSFGVQVTDHTRLRLEGISGNVTIIGTSGADSVIVTGEKRVGSESIQDAQDHMQYLQVSVSDAQGEVFVKTTQPDQTQGRAYVVDYVISLPQSLMVVVSNVNGTVAIDSLNSSLSVQNVNGQVILNEIFGSATVSLVNGQIQAEITLPEGSTIALSAVNGGIGLAIPQNTSADFSASVVNGVISMSDLILHNLVSTPNSLTGRLGAGQGAIGLSTVNGTISVFGF